MECIDTFCVGVWVCGRWNMLVLSVKVFCLWNILVL